MSVKNYFLALNIHLLLPCTIALILGIWWYSLYAWYTAAFAWSCAASLCAALYHATLRQFCIVGSFFFLGLFLHHRQHDQFERFQHLFDGQMMTIEGTVTAVQKTEHPHLRQIISLDLDTAHNESKKLLGTPSATVQLYSYTTLPLLVADRVSFSDVVFKKPSSEDFAWYLQKEGIYQTIFLTKPRYTLLHRPRRSLWRKIAREREQLLVRCKKKLSPAAYALFSLVFFGNKHVHKKQLEAQQHYFRLWGISHHLARSGLHLVLLVVFLSFFFNFLPLPFFLKQFLLLFIMIIYALLSWPSISFTRALITFLLYKLCTFMELPIPFMHIVTMVTLLVLLFNPSQLFFLDFQLSFGLTFALAWINYLNKHRRFMPF